MLSPAPGNHWIWFQGRLIRFLRSREKSKVDQVLMDFYESYTLQTWGRKRDILESLVKEAVAAFARQAEGCTRVWIMARYDGWREVSRLPHRSLDSVVLPEGAREFLSQDLEQFANARERYAHLGVPYRRGYLFYGPPGTGKTSLGMALASHLNLDIAVVSLGDAGLDDNKLVNFLLEAPQGAVLLLEDLDCLYQEDRTKKQTGVTLSGLLNILDGVAAQESRVVIMTTNHPEKLDEALIRPGRADVHMLLENATLFQSRCLFQRFFPKASPAQAEEFAQRMGDRKQSPANIQRHLMAYQGSAEAALENAQDIGLGRFRK
jgi:chaperone BCS1